MFRKKFDQSGTGTRGIVMQYIINYSKKTSYAEIIPMKQAGCTYLKVLINWVFLAQ